MPKAATNCRRTSPSGSRRLAVQQGCPGPAPEVLLGALLAAAVLKSGPEEPPGVREAGVWIYGEARPAWSLDADDALLLMCANALHQAGNDVPKLLSQELARDAAEFIEKYK